jgi:hypothetical protein
MSTNSSLSLNNPYMKLFFFVIQKETQWSVRHNERHLHTKTFTVRLEAATALIMNSFVSASGEQGQTIYVISKKIKLLEKLEFWCGFCDHKHWATGWKWPEKQKEQYITDCANGKENDMSQWFILITFLLRATVENFFINLSNFFKEYSEIPNDWLNYCY